MLEFIRDGKRLVAPDGTPEALSKIMQKCWEAEPNDRPTFVQLQSEFTTLLESETNDYGYLAHSAWIDDQKSPGTASFAGFSFDKRPSQVGDSGTAN
uniref:Serine-threonine/tyrosine-protein kinase catalytic domain-containing protein n=1 Tax=Panagrolaimus sp. JU765 TaxID=591449 RepID=A0AC34QXD8_9BILA